jgi:hypothetical protein
MPIWMSAQASQLFRAAAAAGLQDADDLAVVRLVEQWLWAGGTAQGQDHAPGLGGA